MALIGANAVLWAAYSYRLVWISGRFGGHKTSLAFEMSRFFLEQGYRLVSNTRSVWNDEMEQISLEEDGHLKTVVILDEGGLYFKAGRLVETIAAYAAKMDCIYLFPSFWPPTRAAQVLTIQPLWNLKAAGVPLVFYRWQVKIGGFSDRGYFAWYRPNEIYGIYSRQDPGAEPGRIIEWLAGKAEQYRARFDYGDRKRGGEDRVFTLETSPEDYIQEAAIAIADAAQDIVTASVPKRKNRR